MEESHITEKWSAWVSCQRDVRALCVTAVEKKPSASWKKKKTTLCRGTDSLRAQEGQFSSLDVVILGQVAFLSVRL